ncbi:A24 family peptidase [Virgibacillus salarius]|uniref:prepilin peptidase n=1 Tax=Virgibacillus salarius TaxID=447199 RepID=UPI0003F62928|nr:A24 family peptidase [Priestia megaterium]
MNTFTLSLFFLVGLLFGSFYNVVGLRLPKQLSFIMNRSNCIHCSHQLHWYELIPILSFLCLKGRCSKCSNRISYLYPLIEISTGLLFVYSYLMLGWNSELIIALQLVSMLMIITVSDLTYMVIPNKLLLFFLPLFFILRIISPLTPWWSPLLGGLLGVCITMFIILISRGGMGAGDMKLFGVLGIVLGYEKLLLCFFLSCVVGAVFGMLLLVIKKIQRKQPVAFGPYIVIATLITYFYGDAIIDWYFRYL